ncbi:hypothetical protein GO491_10785 [Flavobacteriaceae bacterium Ap0902]|nr:hypothetical protein [Flavobacteriaceae bacterium Ap0902]
MKSKHIIIAPVYQQFMAGRIWMGLDTKIIENQFKKLGWETNIISFDKLVDSLDDIPYNAVLFYSSVYNENYLRYIQDTILFITHQRPDIKIFPKFNQLYALENKGFQEYMKKMLGIERVKGKYYGDIDELVNDKLTFPFVLKENKGALSSGVHLIKSENELIQIQKRLKKQSLKEKIAFQVNKRNSFNKDQNLNPRENLLEINFTDYFQKRIPVIYQEFIPDLKCDYKVLQFGNKYYTFKRETRENDFRASGSGKFSFEEAPVEVLNFSKSIIEKLKTPFVSIDVGIDDSKNCYLFEFQGTAFGPIGLTQSNFYSVWENNRWNKIEEKSILEEEYANAIDNFVKRTNEDN